MNLRSLFHKPKPFITIVSARPRSGTSLMMQVLQAGGIPPLTDRERAADDDNPKGYYELERVKKLKEGDSAWIKEAANPQGAPSRAVKVISALLEHLPPDYDYKVIFMQREMAEILASQKQMLLRRGEPVDAVSDEVMASLFTQHLAKVQKWLAQQKNIQVLYMPYARLVDQPAQEVARLVKFLGVKLDEQAMRQAPDQSLHRQRR